MLPDSPVVHTEATVSIGLKNVLGVGTSILHFFGITRKGRCQFPERNPIYNITVNRNRCASGSVQLSPSFPLHKLLTLFYLGINYSFAKNYLDFLLNLNFFTI